MTRGRMMGKMGLIVKKWREHTRRMKAIRREKLELLVMCFGAWKVEHHLAKLG